MAAESNSKKRKLVPGERTVDMVSNSEGFSNSSDSDEEEEINQCWWRINEDDKKRVLTFFNNGTIQVWYNSCS